MSSVDAHKVQHQNFIMDKSVNLYHHLTERNEGRSHTIIFTNNGINSASELPWITANASNHIAGITEITTDCNKIHPSRYRTAVQFLWHCVRVDQMLLVNEAKAGLVH
jgi:hypothetical protein